MNKKTISAKNSAAKPQAILLIILGILAIAIGIVYWCGLIEEVNSFNTIYQLMFGLILLILGLFAYRRSIVAFQIANFVLGLNIFIAVITFFISLSNGFFQYQNIMIVFWDIFWINTFTSGIKAIELQNGPIFSLPSNTVSSETSTHSIPTKYDLRNLTHSEIALLSVFAVLPSENINYKIIECLVEPMEDLDSILLSLSQKGWIVSNLNTKSSVCSSDLQEFVKYNNENLFEDCRNLINALMELLEYDSHTGHPINISLKEAVMFAHFGESVVKALEPKNHTVRFLCDRLGNYFKITGDLTKAFKYFTEFNQLAKELCETNPGNVKYKNNLAISYQKLGDIYTTKSDLEKALTCFSHFNQLAKELYKDYPENVKYKSNLAISYEKIGDIYTAKGNQEKALMFYFQHNQLTEKRVMGKSV